MDDVDLSAIFDDPELLAQLSELGLFGEKHGLEGEKAGDARAYLGEPMPQGRFAGGTFVASNPLEFAAAAASRIKGQKGLEGSYAVREGLFGKERDALRALVKALRSRKDGIPTPPKPGELAPYGDDWR